MKEQAAKEERELSAKNISKKKRLEEECKEAERANVEAEKAKAEAERVAEVEIERVTREVEEGRETNLKRKI